MTLRINSTVNKTAPQIVATKLSLQINIECQPKHSYIYVIYKVLVYVQTSEPTTCFGLFQLGHLQVGHKRSEELYNNALLSIKSRGDEISFTTLGSPNVVILSNVMKHVIG